MKDSKKMLLEYLGFIIEKKQLSAKNHSQNVRLFSEIILDKVIKLMPEYKLSEKDKDDILFASAMHDVGKVTIPDNILHKPGRLTDDEYEVLKNHTRNGKKIFEHVMKDMDENSEEYRQFKVCADVCMCHHERYDGEGYPAGLTGDEIPIAAQIIGLADAYDALLSDLIYKSAYTKEKAFEMIMEGECGVFSPELLEIFQMSRLEMEDVLELEKE